MNHEESNLEMPTTLPSDGSVENEPKEPTPRIYVASLADYNAGRLHGTWIDATLDKEQINEAVTTMLKKSPEPFAEEYAIHDFEGFGPVRLGEYESLDTVERLAQGISEHGMAFAHFASCFGTTDADLLDDFENAYIGHYGSVKEYAEELLVDLGAEQVLEKMVPEGLASYIHIDVDFFANDLEISGDIMTSEGDEGVYIFWGQW